MSQIDHTITLV